MPGSQLDSPRSTGRPSLFVTCLVVLCLALAGVDVALALRNRRLTERVGELTQLVHAAERSVSTALDGRPFPAVKLVDARAEAFELTHIPESHGTLLLVSSLSCEYCTLATPAWERAARRAAGTHLRVAGLVLDSSPDELEASSASYPMLAPQGDASSLVRQLPGVPAAVFVDSSGVVWRAVYGGEQAGLDEALEEFLGLGLDLFGAGR